MPLEPPTITSFSDARSPLTKLFDECRSDKGTYLDGNLYSLDYERLVPRDTSVLLEIGIGTHWEFNGQCGSIRAWLEWITGEVYGFDIEPPPPRGVTKDLLQHPRFHFIEGDQSKRADLEQLARALPPCDIIIDDGSHYSEDQFLTLDILWPCVKPGGVYVVEDVHLRYGRPPYPYDVLPHHPCFESFIGLRQAVPIYMPDLGLVDYRGVVLRKPAVPGPVPDLGSLTMHLLGESLK